MNLSSIDSILNGGITTKSSRKGEIKMILYTKPDCPLCTVAKLKLNAAEINYEISTDEEVMDKLNLDRLPVLQLSNGALLSFKEILQYIDGGNLKNEN
jgi:hypothetical protein